MQSCRRILIASLVAVAVMLAIVYRPRTEPVAGVAHMAGGAPPEAVDRDGAPLPLVTEPLARVERASVPTVAAAAADPANNRSGIRLRIVSEHGAPLAGAEYFEGPEPFASMAGLLEREAWQQRWQPDAWLTATCARQVADADGYVDARPSHGQRLYVARRDGRIAFGVRPLRDELRFRPDRTCRVTVVDASGQPIAGAAVSLRRESEPVDSREPIVGITDAHGACVVSHLERLAPDAHDLDHLPRFGVRGLGLRSADVPFDPASPPAELTLTLPPCGTVAVELLDPSGARLASPEPVLLLGPDGEQLTEYTRATGPIEFGLCAVGLQLAVTHPEHHRFAGPRRAGERIVESLRLTDLEPNGCFLMGRAVRSDGTPLANCGLYAQPGTYSVSKWTTTSAAGRFLFAYAADDMRDSASEEGFGIVAPGDGATHVPRREARLQLSDRLRPGILELGDVVLQDAVVLARGRVRDARGPLPGARIETGSREHGVEIVALPDAHFEVRGLPNRDHAWLSVGAPGHARRSVRAALPCADLDIVLELQGSCEAVVLVEPELLRHPHALRFELVDPAGARQRGKVHESHGSWLCSWAARPGTYRCEVRVFQSREPLAVVSGVVVAADGPASEPVRIDLRNRLHAARLSWVNEAGEPVLLSFADAYVPGPPTASGSERAWDGLDVDDYGCWLIGTGGLVTIAVENGEFAGTWSGPFGNADVTVRAVPEVPFMIPDLPAAPDGGEWTVRAIARSGDATIVLRRADRTDLRKNGFTFGHVAAEGRGALRLLPNSRYSIELLFSPGERSWRERRSLRVTPGTVSIDATLPRELTFRVDPQQLQAVLR